MKRVAAPEIVNYHKAPRKLSGVSPVRKELPPRWLLAELLFHTIKISLDAYEKITARMLLDNVLSMRDGETNKDAFFNWTYSISYNKSGALHDKFMESVSKEEWDTRDYLEIRNERFPEYQVGVDAGNFLLGEYYYLLHELRAVIDFAFSGFMFNAVSGPDFAALCKNKKVDAATMALEQKLEEELDHEALYNRLLSQLGHA